MPGAIHTRSKAHQRVDAAIKAGEPVSDEDRWRPMASAPVNVHVEVQLRPGAVLLAIKTQDNVWRNSVTRRPLKVRPQQWRMR